MPKLDRRVVRNFVILFSTILISVLIDQITKIAILRSFRFGETKAIIKGFFNLTYVRNQGAAFSLFNSAPAVIRDPFFIMLPVIAFGVISVLFVKNPTLSWVRVTALSLVAGGALGNLVDRVKYGYVVDFLHFHYRDMYHYPMFNYADCCIVVGVAILFILSLKKK